MSENLFVSSALADITTTWSPTGVMSLSSMSPPDAVLGAHRHLLRGDANVQWAKWFAESLMDPRKIADQEIEYPFIFSTVWSAVDQRFRDDKTKSQKQELAASTAKALQRLSKLWQSGRKRRSLTKDEKRMLLDISGTRPRCWICGAQFLEIEVDNFLFGRTGMPPLPKFVDVLKPSGLESRDLRIEIDHVVPFSRGGGDEENLRLACGWCNRTKSGHMSVYDVEGQPLRAGQNSLGFYSLPQPFWVTRLLALEGVCSHGEGCEITNNNADLTVIPLRSDGALNITNLRVTCLAHDPLGSRRLQVPTVVRSLWRK